MAVPDEGFLHSADGVPLFYREWPVANARGAVLIAHGLGEHSGRYGELAGLFNSIGLSVRAQDHRGHGRSGGARGSIARPDDFLQDLHQHFTHFSATHKTVPFLFGHSMGGLIAARFATGGFAVVRGVMLSSPALAIRLSAFQRFLLAMGSALAPGFAISSGLPAGGVSRDPDVLQGYGNDLLNHNKVAPRVVRFMLDAITQCMRDAPTFTAPLLLQFAGDDLLVDAAGSELFYEKLPTAHKNRVRYNDAYHEIFNEVAPLRRQVHSDVTKWLERQLNQAHSEGAVPG
jgi:alpha-beta hydrolase superfamily lysophospholipase